LYALPCFVIVLLLLQGCDTAPPATTPPSAEIAGAGRAAQQTEFVYCHWNVENFFDDKNDGRTGPGDKEYDPLFAEHPDLLKLKLSKLTEAILKMNAGKGPDILSIVEVESLRAAELLQKALNDKLRDPKLHYEHILMKEVAGGRHIAPAIITRLPVVKDRTRLLGNRQRILEGRVVVNGHELIIIASHWTSRLQESGKKGRADYADKIYGACNAIFRSNPAADFLISGDFNDDPDDESVTKHLHATGDLQIARSNDGLHLFNLFAGKDPKLFGTHYYKQWHIFDQILVSPGMLDKKGWSCEPQSVEVFNELHKAKDKLKRPWRFGSEHEKGERGYSDHFPVLVRLHLDSAELSQRK
jgi:endonuclease/exonuclease/phosphatase family metal-dependent hydrolase